MVRKLFEAGMNFYEKQPFYCIENVCHLVKLAVAGTVCDHL